MKLRELLMGIIDIPESQNRNIEGLCLDSRKVQLGDLFLAFPGAITDGRQFIANVSSKGINAILAEAENFDTHFNLSNSDIPLILVPQLTTHIGKISSRFYSEPSHTLQMIGVTGTNGKTSTTHFIAQALNQINSRYCGVIGTVGYGIPPVLQENTHTTPDAIALQQMLANFVSSEVKAVAMEVSSHALVQNRVADIQYDIGVFTNLTRDHLDYHGDMASYGAAKQKLFTDFPLHHAVINIDDPFAETLIAKLSKNVSLISYSTNNLKADVCAKNIDVNREGIFADLHTPWGNGSLNCNLLGRFHLQNILAVIGCLGALKIPLSEILVAMRKIQGVAGRMQAISFPDKPLVVVDYAHTPDALMNALTTLREVTQGKLWCVFGCGGNRDKGKRPIMGSIAEQYSDLMVITDDNPRHEDPQNITTDILTGITNRQNIIIEHDRQKAIQYAIQHAKPNDTILVAGKGHEPYQQIGDEKLPFDDAKVVSTLLL